MALRLASGIAAGLARLIGFARDGRKRQLAAEPSARDRGVLTGAAPLARPSRYAIVAPLLHCLGGWTVLNRARNRVVATGLSRRHAETLTRVLDLAYDCHPHSSSDAVTRKGED
jgi:hypothetical protein